CAQNGNLSHEVGGVSDHQAPTIGDMARDDMSSQVTHSYSRDGSAPTWNALNERDSSIVTDDDWKWMMIGSDDMKEFTGDGIDWNASYLEG
nr:transcription factor MYB44-like protein [Tanacetum cinerariifolium]